MSHFTRFARLLSGFTLGVNNKHPASDDIMNMLLNYLIFFMVAVFILGCSISRTMDVSIAGNNIVTPYGRGDVDFEYQSNTNTELLNVR
jgi:hypothetical protein